MNIIEVFKIELHYFFNDNSHHMDAIVRHKCETQFLNISKEIIETLGLTIDIDNEAYREGGLKEIWLFMGKQNAQLMLLLTLIIGILSRVPMPVDSEMEQLQKEKTQLEIELLKKKLHDPEFKFDYPPIFDNPVKLFDSNTRVMKSRSNFYYEINNYHKIEKISFQELRVDNTAINKASIVNRSSFDQYILHSDELPNMVVEDAFIEIISPVLKMGKYKWRGIYNNEPIDFWMNDKEYTSSVLKSDVTFQNGYAIEAILHINRKIDDVGSIKNTSYSIEKVLGSIESGNYNSTVQGERHKRMKKDISNQRELDFPS